MYSQRGPKDQIHKQFFLDVANSKETQICDDDEVFNPIRIVIINRNKWKTIARIMTHW